MATVTSKINEMGPRQKNDADGTMEARKTNPLTVVSPAEREGAEKRRKALYEKAVAYASGVLDAVRKNQSFSLEAGFEIMRKAVEIPPPADPLFIRALHRDNARNFLPLHLANVAIYNIRMADYLGWTRDRQMEIGMAGLLHDIGNALVPNEIINKTGKLSKREFEIIKKRPENAWRILKSFGKDYARLAQCALEVHERIDGSGYPNGLKAGDIGEYAKITGLSDIYEAMTHTRPHREKYSHFKAAKEILKSEKNRFEKSHIKALLGVFSFFPVHSHVKLNSNAVGRVLETYSDQPMRPVVKIILDSQRKRVRDGSVLDLAEHPLLYVVDAVPMRAKTRGDTDRP